MNYRHAFHAGNFADLVKHATVTLIQQALNRDPDPLTVIDTHAGAGAYDLTGEMSRRSGEAAAGIFRLMEAQATPAAFDALKAAVARMNPAGGVTLYPGSPSLIGAALRPQDRYVACELREDDHDLLRRTLARYPNAKAVRDDGYETAVRLVPPGARAFVLIDPPFERADDYTRIAEAIGAILSRNPQALVAVWVPLKDLETLDSFLRQAEEAAPLLVAEARLRPLNDPMKMNGCAMVIANAPTDLVEPLTVICQWVSGALGDAGGSARVWRTDEG